MIKILFYWANGIDIDGYNTKEYDKQYKRHNRRYKYIRKYYCIHNYTAFDPKYNKTIFCQKCNTKRKPIMNICGLIDTEGERILSQNNIRNMRKRIKDYYNSL